MAYTPGELLLRGGAITAEAHRRALAMRAAGGGSIGECLIKLGVIDEVRLATFYHKRLILPLLTEANLRQIARAVLDTVPAEVAAEFRVLPIAIDREGALLVAMADPSDNHAVEELAFFVDRFVLRAVAPESAVRRAIEHHYQLSLDAGAPSAAPPPPAAERPRAAFIATPASPPQVVVPPPVERREDPVVLLTRKKRFDETPLPPPIPARDGTDPGAEPHLLTQRRHGRMSTLPGLQSEFTPPPLEALRAATDRDAVARHLLDYAARVLGRAVLFVVRTGALVGLDARGGDLERASVEVLQVPLAADSIFRDVTQTRLPYRGPLPPTPHNRTLARALGASADQDVLVLPIQVRDRVVAVLFGDRLSAALPEASLQVLCYEAGLAYERILRQARANPAAQPR